MFVSKFKQNDPEYVIIECVVINFKHTREIKVLITNEHGYYYYFIFFK